MASLARAFADRIDEVVRKLVTVEHFHAASVISMPVLYPSGASVVLELSRQSDRVFVSDRGGGYLEAEYMGATVMYGREAQRIATDSGIKFDGRDMFIAEVPLERVHGALTVVASASSQAAAMAALKAADRDERVAKDKLFEKLTMVFGATGFDRDVKLIGASNHQWRVDALVKTGDRLSIFNSVTPKYVSATGTAAKFHDLARLEIAPTRIAVIASTEAIGDWYGVIRSASDAVIELDAANDRFYSVGIAA